MEGKTRRYGSNYFKILKRKIWGWGVKSRWGWKRGEFWVGSGRKKKIKDLSENRLEIGWVDPELLNLNVFLRFSLIQLNIYVV